MKEYIIHTNQELITAFSEIQQVLNKTKAVKIIASSIRTKSKQQLGYYWAVILPALTNFINENGHCNMKVSKSDVNEIMNRKFFYTEAVINGEMIQIPKSKSGATLEQMREFIDNVMDYCANLGIFIPPPYEGSIYD